MRKASAFCPAYATGIFTIEKGDAAGAGFCISKGMTTVVSESPSGKIFINGKRSLAKVSRAVIRKFQKHAGSLRLEVRHQAAVPIGYGLGMSAAGALSLSLALNELLGCGFPRSQCVKIAHDCEVECGTGLSGADAASLGGLLALRRVGEKPIRIEAEGKKAHFAFFSPIKTSSVILQKGWKRKVNFHGKKALDRLFSQRSWEGFISASRSFAQNTGLADWCKGELDANPHASMAMLGKTLFSASRIVSARKPRLCLEAEVSGRGAEVL
ncbi:MAG: hypothetical protein N3F07_01395 [Candidatus Micrarchaeota archaeon]|nr:hypothetical protein [Candidatus Micrarchaeota archaeon]